MRFKNECIVLWYGLPDTPVPPEVVPPDKDVSITIGVCPADASNRVEILYRVNDGSPQRLAATPVRQVETAQYFTAILSALALRSGDLVRYVAVCHCVERQVPSREEAEEFLSTFRVLGQATHCPLPKIPDTLDESGLNSAVAARLSGAPANGTAAPQGPHSRVIWVESGDEVLVHLDSISTRIADRTLLVSVDLETDQTGRTPLVVALALGGTGDSAGLIAVTDQLPRGNGLLASRWGETVQRAVWASLLELSGEHAAERLAAPLGLTATSGALRLHAGPQLSADALRPGGLSR